MQGLVAMGYVCTKPAAVFSLPPTLVHTPSSHLVSIVDCCDEWYELMVGQLLFTSPLVLSTDYDMVGMAEVSLLWLCDICEHV